MSNQSFNSEEAIELLRILLHEDQHKRRGLAAVLHAKKTDLATVGLMLASIERNAADNKKDPDSLQKMRSMIKELIGELRALHTELFPSIVNLAGLPISLKQFIRDCQEKYKKDIKYSDTITDPINNSAFEVGIYKVCAEILNDLCLAGNKKISISLIHHKKNITVEITSVSAKKNMESKAGLKGKVQLIKAMAVWLEAEISPRTNWENVFKMTFHVK